ncbi:MAG: J domain-containing protein [Chloroflexi bacterium]|nr:J domain-containing protein [Chloroflexota bacterium]
MTIPNEGPLDYYAVLQVQPTATQRVIDVAYRALIRDNHPDTAGDTPENQAMTRLLNEAYTVLRDPARRRQYDLDRLAYGGRRNPPPPPPAPPAAAAPPPDDWSQAQPTGSIVIPPRQSTLPGPLAIFAAAYYLLPGPYEWEQGSGRELLAVGLLPVVGVVSFALLTGRLAPWIGQSLNATLLVCGLIVVLCLPMLTFLPRVALAGGPSLLLLSGNAAPFLLQVHIPIWFAWVMACMVSLLLAARLFVFGVLPTVAACWLISRLV